eukprot:10587912-Lingulodinium_polyedra.AAC.1
MLALCEGLPGNFRRRGRVLGHHDGRAGPLYNQRRADAPGGRRHKLGPLRRCWSAKQLTGT